MQVIYTFAAVAAVLLSALLLPGAATAQGPSSSLFNRGLPAGAQPRLTLENSSWIHNPPPPKRQLRIHDLVSIRVDEGSQVLSEGQADSRRQGSYEAVLVDWLKLSGIDTASLAPQPNGEPRVEGTFNKLYRAEGELETRESLTFNISARIVDIRPNGNLVLEANRQIRNNNEVWEYSLTGICRPKDINELNLVLSRDIADLRIEKRESGNVRDGYRRGWLTRLIDAYNPF